MNGSLESFSAIFLGCREAVDNEAADIRVCMAPAMVQNIDEVIHNGLLKWIFNMGVSSK